MDTLAFMVGCIRNIYLDGKSALGIADTRYTI